MDGAIVLDVEAGARFQVVQLVRVGQLDTKDGADPDALFERRVDHVDPDRLDLDQVISGADFDLAQAAFMQLKRLDAGFFVLVFALAQRLDQRNRHILQDLLLASLQ